MSNKQKQKEMRFESIYNAKIKVTTPEGFTFKTEIGFLSFGRESFINAVKFRFLNCSVVFTKIWCEDPIDRNDPNYIEY